MQPSNSQVSKRHLSNGIYHWDTYQDAQEYAKLITPRVWQIVQYAPGWVIQRNPGGPCWGPRGWQDLPDGQQTDQQTNNAQWRIVLGYTGLSHRTYATKHEAIVDADKLKRELGRDWECYVVGIEPPTPSEN